MVILAPLPCEIIIFCEPDVPFSINQSLDTVLDKTFQKFEKEGEFKGHRYEWLKSF